MEPSNGEFSNHWGLAFCSTKKTSFFARLLRAHAESNRQRAARVVEQYVADHGLQRLSDDAERQISRLIVKAGRAMLTLIIIHAANRLARFGKVFARRGAKRSAFAAPSPVRPRSSTRASRPA